MKIRAGYEIAFECYQEVPMVLLLSVHPSREKDLLSSHRIQLSPPVQARQGSDPFGNVWTRFVARPGRLEIRNEFLIHGFEFDSGVVVEHFDDGKTIGQQQVVVTAAGPGDDAGPLAFVESDIKAKLFDSLVAAVARVDI